MSSAEGLATVASGRPMQDRWVCLMYHDVLPRTTASGGGPERFAASLESFELMLDVIAAHGYDGVSLAGALARPGLRRVAITFDDGTRSHFDHAAPALRARGMTATFFVTTDWVGKPGYMSWSELRDLVGWGMSVQSHTRSHPFLSELDEAGVRAQLLESRLALDQELGQQTSEIGLPGGDAPAARFRHLLAECGYRVVAGSRWGMNVDGTAGTRRWVRRCTMRGDVDAALAARVITGDRMLGITRQPRESALGLVRSSLGPTRYARWRGRLLDLLAGNTDR